MATALDQIVNIVITQDTTAVPQAGFGIPLIVGPKGFSNSDVIRYYTSPQEMLADGFTTSDIEYTYAVEAFEQALSPVQVGIGKRTPAMKQVDTLNVLVANNSTLYSVSLDGVPYDYTSDGSATPAEIVTGLAALINADPAAPAVATDTGPLVLTAKAFGRGFATVNNCPGTSLVNTTANNGIATDLAAILNDPNGNLWYGMALCSNQVSDIEQAAAFIETVKKIYIAASGDAAVDTASTTDVASVLQGKGYKRTALWFSPGSYNLGGDAAWLGGQLPQTPGASTWKFKPMVGITPDFFTGNSRNRLIGAPGVSNGKGCNIYENVGGANITQNGIMVGGQFIDITVGIDWLESTMQTNIYALLVNAPKIPYTDKGVSIIENAVLQTLKQGSDDGGTGLLDSTSIVVTTIPVLDVPSNTRAQRILPSGSVKFSARLTGAFHNVIVNGLIAV